MKENSVSNLEAPKARKSPLWRVLFMLILPPILITVVITVFALGYSVFGNTGEVDIDAAIAENIAYLFVFNHILVFCVLLWFLRIDGLKLADIGFRLPDDGAKGIMIDVGLAVISTAIVIALLTNILPLFEDANNAAPRLADQEHPLGNVLLFALFSGVIVASFVEESVYRGYGITRLNVRWGIVAAVLVTSVLFGPLHYGFGVVGIFRSMFQGFVMALLFVRSRSLLGPMTAHSLTNLYSELSAFEII